MKFATRAEASGVSPPKDAEFSPADPAQLVECSIDDADIDEESGELRCKLSDGSVLDIKPGAAETDDDPPIGS